MSNQENKSVLEFKDITFAYEPHLPEVLCDVSFVLPARSFTAVVGPSGSGKSTILRLAIGLEKATKGVVMNEAKTRMVFQNAALLPWLSALDNVLLGLENTKLSKQERRKRAMNALADLGLQDFAQSYPRDLSGGQRQRVGIARALVTEPDLLLLDEPFSALDVETTESLSEQLLDIFAKRIITMLLISHSIEDAVLLADRVLVFAKGKIVHHVDIDLSRPRVRTDKTVMELVAKIKDFIPKS